MAALISKPGITSAGMLSIPATWSATWFRGIINSYLTGADVRNAIAGPGIKITGTLASPYATISAGGAGAPFTAPVIVKTSGGITVFEVFNSTSGPVVEAYGPNAGGLVDMTPDTGSFTATLTGCTTAPTCTVVWARIGNLVILWIPNNNATSNSASCSLTGLPTELQPARSQNFLGAVVFDAGVAVQGGIEFNTGSGTMTLLKNAGGGTGVTTTFTNSATAKGWNSGVVSYILN